MRRSHAKWLPVIGTILAVIFLNSATALLEPWLLRAAMYDGQYTVARISDYYATPHPDIIFLGSSHALDGLDPQVTQRVLASSGVTARALNLAVTGSRLDVMHLILKNVIRDDKKPSVVVLGIRPEDLGAAPNSYATLPYTELIKRADDADFAGDTLELKLGFVTQQVCLYCRDLSLMKNALSIAFNPSDPYHKLYRPGPEHIAWPADGFYSPGEHTQAPANVLARARAELGGLRPVHFAANSDSLEVLHRLVAVAAARGIKVVLVDVPVSPEYVGAWDPPDLASYLTTIHDAAAREGVPLFEAYTDSDHLVPDDGFFDLDHLNQTGARALTQALTERYLLSLVGAI